MSKSKRKDDNMTMTSLSKQRAEMRELEWKIRIARRPVDDYVRRRYPAIDEWIESLPKLLRQADTLRAQMMKGGRT